MLYFAATFSLVMPIGIKQLVALLLANRLSETQLNLPVRTTLDLDAVVPLGTGRERLARHVRGGAARSAATRRRAAVRCAMRQWRRRCSSLRWPDSQCVYPQCRNGVGGEAESVCGGPRCWDGERQARTQLGSSGTPV